MVACSSSDSSPATLGKRDSGKTPPPDPPPDDDGGVINPTPTPPGPGDPGRVYANTLDTLYLFEPLSKKLTVIGKFSCLQAGEAVIDIAVDRAGTMYATTYNRFLKVDPIDASCVEKGTSAIDYYPNSLSFVPAGTVDPTKEALVGYVQIGDKNTQYTRIDVDNGTMTTIGDLNTGSGLASIYSVSGDIISLIQAGNKSYVTLTDEPFDASAPPDKLAEIDPKTGVIKKIIGSTNHHHIWGFGYWAGKGYGFSDDGTGFAIDMTNGTSSVVVTLTDAGSPVPWYGAGVTTLAPIQ